jgi:Sigma-70, region 4
MSAATMLPVVWGEGALKAAVGGVAVERQPSAIAGEQPAEELAFYRKHTQLMLRRFMHMSMQMGRTPSLLGEQVFRGRVSSYRLRSFEDAVIFVFDIEKCLKQLDHVQRELIGRIALQEYTQGETAALMGMSLRSVVRKYGEAMDRLTAIFLSVKLLTIPGMECCQGAERTAERPRP